MKITKTQFNQIFKQFEQRLKNLKTIDLIGLFLIILITVGAYFVLNRDVSYVYLTMRVFNSEYPEAYLDNNQPKSWYVEQIQAGKKSTNSLGQTMVEISDVYSYPGPAVYHDVYLKLKVRTYKNKSTQQYVYQGSPLLIHDVRSFKIRDLLVSGEIIDITQEKEQRERKKFKVKFQLDPKVKGNNVSSALIRGVENHIAQALKVGLVIEDSQGRKLVQVREVSQQLGIRSYVTSAGYQTTIDPNHKQVTLGLVIEGEKINQHYYYRKEAPLIVDQQLYLIFDQLAVLGTITEIEPLSP